MAVNIEIKAVARDIDALARVAEQLAGQTGTRLVQHDVFFRTMQGLLKLRQINGAEAELIAYSRAPGDHPRPSVYSIASVASFQRTREVLAAALGELAEVRKVRTLFLVGRTRIHLDRIEGLGDFLELEVVLTPSDEEASGRAEAEALMNRLGVGSADLLDQTYAEMLCRSG